MKQLNGWKIITLLCLTLGLAPYAPEPHLWGKLHWVAGSATDIQPIDWFDLLLQASPIVLLFGKVVLVSLKK